MKLYEISRDYLEIMDSLTAEEAPDDIREDIMQQMDGEWTDKAFAVAAYIQNLEADAVGIKNAMAAMKVRQERKLRKADRLRDYLMHEMRATNHPSFERPEFVVKIRKNPVAVEIDNAAEIPPDFIVTKSISNPDKNAIKDALKAGEDVPGCHLVQREKLEIK